MTGPAGAAPADLPAAAERVIGSYLAQVAHRLIGPARARRDILAELGAGLADATDAYHSAGLDPDQAVRAAITEFGQPHPAHPHHPCRPELPHHECGVPLLSGRHLTGPAGA